MELIDLGLSVKWANMNIGANSEEGYGEYLNYDDACKYFENREDRMPSNEEFEELLKGTAQEIVEVNGVKGTKFTSNVNGNYIFVPFAGYGDDGSIVGVGYGYGLWSSSFGGIDYAWRLGSSCSGYCGVYHHNYRHSVCSVRGVSDK